MCKCQKTIKGFCVRIMKKSIVIRSKPFVVGFSIAENI